MSEAGEGDVLMSVDCGTQSVRAALFDVAGAELAVTRVPIVPYFCAAPGFAEQHADYFWSKLCEATGRLLAGAGQQRGRIKGVAVTSQRGVSVNVDAEGRPLRPAISWLDRRQASGGRWAPRYLELALRLRRRFDTATDLRRRAPSNWIREHEPDVWARTYRYLLLSGYLHHRLTGRFVESTAHNFGYLPINHRTFDWAGRFDPVRHLFPIERGKLPELVPIGTTIGAITRRASRETGIPEGLPLVAAASDKACEALGAGVLDARTAYLSFGTLATVNAIVERPVELLPMLPPFPAALPGRYMTEIQVLRGFWLVTWFKKEFGLFDDDSAERVLEELARQVSPGSDGLVLQPYWSPNRAYCDDFGRGSVIGFSERHTRAHVYRAILEGLVFALKDGADLTAAKLGREFQQLRVSGGGARSDTAVQIAADVFGLPATRPAVRETSSLGAAIVAAVGLGHHPSFDAAVRAMTHAAPAVEPIPRNRALYRELHERVYRRIYTQLRPVFAELAQITSGAELSAASGGMWSSPGFVDT